MKVDFHTHSIASPDGSLTLADYRQALDLGSLDYIAITDHNTTAFASYAQKELGDRIIIGEEITTKEGELIGLFLKQPIQKGLSARETANSIHAQGGLVYVPHPFETVRKGITLATLNAIADIVDIIETHNGRAVFQNFTKQAVAWSRAHNVPAAAGSDSHGRHGWGRTYSLLNGEGRLTPKNLCERLGGATLKRQTPSAMALIYPKLNRVRKRVGHA